MRPSSFKASLDQMERWLDDPSWTAEPGEVAAWEVEYRVALEEARGGPDWASLRERAHVLGRRLEEKLRGVISERDALKAELDGQAQGRRALKAYRSGGL